MKNRDKLHNGLDGGWDGFKWPNKSKQKDKRKRGEQNNHSGLIGFAHNASKEIPK